MSDDADETSGNDSRADGPNIFGDTVETPKSGGGIELIRFIFGRRKRNGEGTKTEEPEITDTPLQRRELIHAKLSKKILALA